MRVHLPDPALFVGKCLPGKEAITLNEHVASGNDGHLFRAHSQELGRDLACKIIPRANLVSGPNGEELWRGEVLKADVLRNQAVVKFIDVREWADAGIGFDCVVLLSEYIDGPSLKKFLKERSADITVTLSVQFLETMLELFNEMKLRNVAHGDLHAGNIIVEDRAPYALRGDRFAFRVTDFGVAEATSDHRFKCDYEQLADILSQFLALLDYQALSPKDKYTFKVLRNDFVGRHLIEVDPTRDPVCRQPQELFKRVQEIGNDYDSFSGAEATELLTPFDFLSCEQIGDAPILLQALYSDRFLGLQEIESRNNIVVTGPRGCGKSTVFKSLSLNQRMRVGEASPDKAHYIGVYYRCDDLYFAFPRYAIPSRAEALDIPIHFITATLLSELLDVVERWSNQNFQAEFLRSENEVVRRIWEALEILPPNHPGSGTFRALVSELQKQRRKAVERHRFALDVKRSVGRCFGAEVLQKVCGLLGTAFPFLKDRPFYFFIDDYSAPKVTKDLQLNLNRVLMQRTASCFFKLSTESPVSFAKSDIDEKIYVESREYILHNLGLVFLHADSEPKMAFVEDVFRKRLAKTVGGYPVRELEELIGTNPQQNNNEDARQIRGTTQPISRWGKEALCKLCSGDIHYLISLVGDMVRAVGGKEELSKLQQSPRIGPRVQNKAIREAAGRFLKNLRSVPKYGDKLVAIVEAFGNVCHSHLRYLDSTNEEGTPPKQATRIEPYEPLSLCEEAQLLYDELLRYSVFIEDVRGKSRRGKVVPRLYMRRFLIPHFNLTFSTRDSIELEPEDFERFLLDPTTFEEVRRLKGPPADEKPGADTRPLTKKVDPQIPFNFEGTTKP